MSPRDNRDEIPIDDLVIERADEHGVKHKLRLDWTAKDKLRSATVVGESLRVEFEEVSWRVRAGSFAMLWVVAGGVVRPLYPMRWAEATFVRSVPAGGGLKKEYRIDVPLSRPNMPVVGRYGLLFAAPTTRSAIRVYELERREEPNEPEDPTDPEDPVSEPANLLESVKEERAKYPARITDDQAGAIVNAVAWRHRHDGWGVARKAMGAHALQPRTGVWISRDILIHEPSQRMYDVLSSVSDGQAIPAWNYAGPQDMEFIAAVRPEGAAPPDDDTGDPADDGSVPDVDPSGPPDCSEQVRAARVADADALDAIEAKLRAPLGEGGAGIGGWGGLGVWQRITQAPKMLRAAERVIAEDYRALLKDMRGDGEEG